VARLQVVHLHFLPIRAGGLGETGNTGGNENELGLSAGNPNFPRGSKKRKAIWNTHATDLLQKGSGRNPGDYIAEPAIFVPDAEMESWSAAAGFQEIVEERTRIAAGGMMRIGRLLRCRESQERPGEYLQRRYSRLINSEERGWRR
jgi:hypothetical protein